MSGAATTKRPDETEPQCAEMINREPALLFAFSAAVFALIGAYGLVDEGKLKLWEALFIAGIPVIQGFLTRAQVMPVATINEAGLTSRSVHDLADNKDVLPVREDDEAVG